MMDSYLSTTEQNSTFNPIIIQNNFQHFFNAQTNLNQQKQLLNGINYLSSISWSSSSSGLDDSQLFTLDNDGDSIEVVPNECREANASSQMMLVESSSPSSSLSSPPFHCLQSDEPSNPNFLQLHSGHDSIRYFLLLLVVVLKITFEKI